MELIKGYTKKDIEQNIEKLIASGQNKDTAVGIAVGYARIRYRKDYPGTTAFPEYLRPGNIRNTYIEGSG